MSEKYRLQTVEYRFSSVSAPWWTEL